MTSNYTAALAAAKTARAAALGINWTPEVDAAEAAWNAAFDAAAPGVAGGLTVAGQNETIPKWALDTDGSVLTSGTVTLVGITLPKGKVITNVGFFSGATAADTPTHWWYALCDSTGAVLAATADQLTAAFAAKTNKPLALSAPFTTTAAGLHYLAVMVAATTPPTLGCKGGFDLTQNNFGVRVAMTGATGRTTAPAATTALAASPTSIANTPYAYVS